MFLLFADKNFAYCGHYVLCGNANDVSRWSGVHVNCTENGNWMSRAALDSAFCTLNAIVTDIYELAGAPMFFRPRVYTLPHTTAGIETIKVRVGGV